MTSDNPKNYRYDDHSRFPFKLVELKPVLSTETETAHRHNFFQLFFFTSNGGHHLIDFEESPCRENSVHVVNPGSIHKLTREPSTRGFVILFSRTFFDQNQPNPNYFIYRNDFDKCVDMPADRFAEIIKLIKNIQAENALKEAFSDKSIRNLIELIAIAVQRYIPFEATPLATKIDQVFDQFMFQLSLNFSQEHSLSFYTDFLAISQEKLNKICQEKLNKTPSELIQERILLEAKRLLFHSHLSIKEIAFALGYEDPSYFNRLFKLKIEQTPASFRSNIREKYYD
ncbi:MAG: AraC family transcriptional activator of pobA [Chitinophagales bacterium]|jgi:AraC family transcriptional activator of pobA